MGGRGSGRGVGAGRGSMAARAAGGAGARGAAGAAGARAPGSPGGRGARAAAGAIAGPVLGLAALGGAAAVAGVVLADPEKRRSDMASAAGGDEMASVKKYFNETGFERWEKIYGETDEVNKVQLDIRTGHAQTIEKVLRWVDEEGGVEGTTVADCGCGTGSLTVPLAMRGAQVMATDISAAMTGEAERRFKAVAQPSTPVPEFAPLDLESVTGKYDTVCCLDVMIHYPQDKADGMVKHLASLADKRLMVSFAPKTPYYSVLKRIGELFPGPSKATRAYLHAEEDVERALNEAGWKVVKREMTGTQFYFSRLLEAVPM